MIINTELIKELFEKQSQADIVRGSGITGSQISRIKHGETSYQNMRLSTAYTLTVYAEHIINREPILELYTEYEEQKTLQGIFLTPSDLLEHLKESDYYKWTEQLDNVSKPDFSSANTSYEIERIMQKNQINGYKLTLNKKFATHPH